MYSSAEKNQMKNPAPWSAEFAVIHYSKTPTIEYLASEEAEPSIKKEALSEEELASFHLLNEERASAYRIKAAKAELLSAIEETQLVLDLPLEAFQEQSPTILDDFVLAQSPYIDENEEESTENEYVQSPAEKTENNSAINNEIYEEDLEGEIEEDEFEESPENELRSQLDSHFLLNPKILIPLASAIVLILILGFVWLNPNPDANNKLITEQAPPRIVSEMPTQNRVIGITDILKGSANIEEVKVIPAIQEQREESEVKLLEENI